MTTVSASSRADGGRLVPSHNEKTQQKSIRAELATVGERLRATQEILQVISHNRDDQQPVFDAILNNAARLCNVPVITLMLLDETRNTFHVAAHLGNRKIPLDPNSEWSLQSSLPIAQSLREARTIHVADMKSSEPYLNNDPTYRRLVDGEGMRTRLSVPLVQQGVTFGAIVLTRLQKLPFDEDEIRLIESFADQAVIALENVRQFREVQGRLERELATNNILSVISQSRHDDVPVFDAILTNATRLCHAPIAGLFLVDEERKKYKIVAAHGANAEFVKTMDENPPDLDPERYAAARAMIEKRVVHVEDLASPTLFGANATHRIATIKHEGIRTALFVPLIWQDQSIGGFGVWRREVKPFHADEIALVETFAVQAVIAIENARQFKALETLNADLSSRVEEQVNEIERMGRLKRFLPAAVADTVVSSGSEDMLKSHRALLGVLFCDIRGFTAFCETAEPEETIEVLQTYHEEMGRLIKAHGAGVDHRMGDGIMVLFNDPLPCDDPAGEAVRLAIDMRESMARLCKRWKRYGHRLGFGVGVSLGYATVGMVGFEGRFDYTASGTAVNLAARLCDEAEDGEILLSPRAAIAIEDENKVASIGEKILKGIREPIEVFRLIFGAN